VDLMQALRDSARARGKSKASPAKTAAKRAAPRRKAS
jgi:hypothetical protein